MFRATRILQFCLLLVLGGLAACSNLGGDLTAPDPDRDAAEGGAHKSSADAVAIDGYLVRFDGREYAGGQTTFSYVVTPAEGAAPLERFFLEVPDGLALPTAFTPTFGRLENLAKFGLYGVIWRIDLEAAPQDDPPQPQAADSLFTVTYAGSVALGTIEALVGVEGGYVAGTVPGPRVGVTVSGTVFVDTDQDGVQDPATEPGLPDVIVELETADTSVTTARTDADGFWIAEGVGSPVTVRVDPAAYPEAGNALLGEYYAATTDLERILEPAGDLDGVDFGFAPLTTEIVDAVTMGELPSNGEDRKFWRGQFKRALVRAHRHHDYGNGPPQEYDGAELLAFLEEIQGLFYADPFAFTPGRELREAYRLLQFRPKNLLDELLQELFVTELNHVANLGLTAQGRRLQADLIAWGESVVIQEQAAATAGAAKAAVADKAGGVVLSDVIKVFKAINTGGGGIIDE